MKTSETRRFPRRLRSCCFVLTLAIALQLSACSEDATRAGFVSGDATAPGDEASGDGTPDSVAEKDSPSGTEGLPETLVPDNGAEPGPDTSPETTPPDTIGPEAVFPETSNPETSNPEPWPDTVSPEVDGPEAVEEWSQGELVEVIQPETVLPPECPALLEVYALDIWGQALPLTGTTLELWIDGGHVVPSGFPIATTALCDAGTITLRLDAKDHFELVVDAYFNGSNALTALQLDGAPTIDGHGVSLSHDLRYVDGETLPVHTLYLGAKHRWFSSQGRPARRGNDVTLALDGEEAWEQVYTDLMLAEDTIHISTWWWESDFELLRTWGILPGDSTDERWANTMMGVLQVSPATKRVLVGEFWGDHDIMDWLTEDDLLFDYAEELWDNFEFMGQGNSTSGTFYFDLEPFMFLDRVQSMNPESLDRAFEDEGWIDSDVPGHFVDLTDIPAISLEFQHASWHQKFLTVDDDVAWIGGMNVKGTDWDTNDHLLFDHRRMAFDASSAERWAVFNKEADSDTRPRKDYIIRIEGPAAVDASEVFQERWSHNIDLDALYADTSTDFGLQGPEPPIPGGIQAQVTATMPEPFAENAILETWWNAIGEAEDYIFIEDQYWRMPMLSERIISRMQEVPSLKLLVITQPVNEWLDPACEWTYAFDLELRQAIGATRYRMVQLRTFDYTQDLDLTFGWNETVGIFGDINVHSKLLIVDDRFVSVGSCNKNNRGLIYEGELNAAVLDEDFARNARRRVFANVLPPGTPATDNVATWWQQFISAAAVNDSVVLNWEAVGYDVDCGTNSNPSPLGSSPCNDAKYVPEGMVYSLSYGTPDDCFIEGVGADMFFW